MVTSVFKVTSVRHAEDGSADVTEASSPLLFCYGTMAQGLSIFPGHYAELPLEAAGVLAF